VKIINTRFYVNWIKHLTAFIICFSINLKAVHSQVNVHELNQIFNKINTTNPDSANLINASILKFGESKNIDTVKALAYLNYSNLKLNENNLDSTIFYLKKALPLSKKSKQIRAEIYKTIAIYYLKISDYQNTLDYNLKSLKLYEELNDSISIAKVNNNLGICYNKLEKPEKALYHYRKCYEFGKQDTIIRLSNYVNISNLACITMNNPDTSDINFLLEGLSFSKRTLNTIGHNIRLYIAASHYYNKNNQVTIAFKYLDSCMAIVDEKDYSFRIEIHGQYSNIYNKIGDYQKSIEHLLIAEDLSKKANLVKKLLTSYQSLAFVYNQSKDYENAVIKLNEYHNLKDSLFSIDKINEINKLQIIHETDEKNKAIELLEKDKLIKEIKLKRSNQAKLIWTLISISIFFLLLLLRYRFKTKTATNLLLQQANQQIFNKKLADAEMNALRAQMNPHFLFNCLNSINNFIIKNEQELASEYLSKFSKLIRKVLSNSKEPKITLSNELEALDLYIQMEQLRFNNKFSYVIDVDDAVEADYLEVPPLIIQPYVENCIWHGLMHKKEADGKLYIKIYQENNMLVCIIEDNGIGRLAANALKSKSAEKNKSFGMSITKERLNYVNRENVSEPNIEIIDLVDDKNNALGTKVIIRISI
jgi:tetratricopeptide (TPR) repeat protein